ncbi:MAG: hypothetical protein ACI36Y_05925 [Coriobacteriales bacterium]
MRLSKRVLCALLALCLALLGALPLTGCGSQELGALAGAVAGGGSSAGSGQQQAAEPDSSLASQGDSYAYTFRTQRQLSEHFDKHGREMGFASPGEYERAASRAATNPYALHKLEKEDGGDVYYLVTTNEFVVVSTDGFIRTYFCPNSGKSYYDRQ